MSIQASFTVKGSTIGELLDAATVQAAVLAGSGFFADITAMDVAPDHSVHAEGGALVVVSWRADVRARFEVS